ncbi:hypothetical protein A7311_19025 [Paenibacillus polymyxa]|nr:hypothetical protein A7311_19025 [Paenibacillus polymyxa]
MIVQFSIEQKSFLFIKILKLLEFSQYIKSWGNVILSFGFFPSSIYVMYLDYLVFIYKLSFHHPA